MAIWRSVAQVASRGWAPDRLILASVQSAFGSNGVVAEHVIGETSNEAASRRYRLLDDAVSLGEQTLRGVLSKWLLAPAELAEIDDCFLD